MGAIGELSVFIAFQRPAVIFEFRERCDFSSVQGHRNITDLNIINDLELDVDGGHIFSYPDERPFDRIGDVDGGGQQDRGDGQTEAAVKLAEARIEVIPNGVDTEVYRPAERPAGGVVRSVAALAIAASLPQQPFKLPTPAPSQPPETRGRPSSSGSSS